jgi:hypothetical protein
VKVDTLSPEQLETAEALGAGALSAEELEDELGELPRWCSVCKQGTEQPCGPECARLAVCLRLLEAQDSRWALTQQPRPRDAWERFVKTKNRLHRNRKHVLRPYYAADDLDALCAAGAEVRAREVPAVPR